MALPAALALSGLGREQFSGELQGIYNHGAMLLKSPSSGSLASTTSSYLSLELESGFSSMSSDSLSLKSPSESYWELLFELDEMQFDSGASDRGESKEENIAEEDITENKITENEIAEDNTTENKTTEDKITEDETAEDNITEDNITEEKITEEKTQNKKIKYCGRDILDLGSNIGGTSGITSAVLPHGAQGFLENRSQYSRVNDLELPPHKIKFCLCCGFQEFHYE